MARRRPHVVAGSRAVAGPPGGSDAGGCRCTSSWRVTTSRSSRWSRGAREAGLDGAFDLTGWLAPAGFARLIAAADVVLALRFPTLGEASALALESIAEGGSS